MLKNIRLHLDKNEECQLSLENASKVQIEKRYKDNFEAFTRNIPSLLPILKNAKPKNVSFFVNKDSQFNLVDFGLGRTFYGLDPEQEISKQIEIFQNTAEYVPIKRNATHIEDDENAPDNAEAPSQLWHKLNALKAPVKPMQCLVVLGCALGKHIAELMELNHVQNLIIYEPELQYFLASAYVADWATTFKLAKQKNINIFLQVGKDGRDLVDDVTQLDSHIPIDGFYLFQHYHHPIFSRIRRQLLLRTWDDIKQHGFHLEEQEGYLEYLPAWNTPISIHEYQFLEKSDKLFIQNIKLLEKFFPDVYEEFKAYQPQVWAPVKMANGEVNLVKLDTLQNWYGEEPRKECNLHYENFYEQPNKDGLLLGYTGEKLAHYQHYQFVKKTEEHLKGLEEQTGKLPSKIKSIILFGLGAGYQLETLLENHTLEHLFVCEPNRDFFYSSLFSLDWSVLIDRINQSKTRVYLNIGDDGSNIMKDLLNQFYSIGPYILASTYFYQSYYNSALNQAIAELREQLKIVILMGEYFDHAYYGINHTVYSIENQYPFLLAKPDSYLSASDKSVPVFIVGNGPSLDYSIEVLKELQEQAIIVSCGTCLKVLSKHGIRPDFHAEIEQNRSTFDWISLVGNERFCKDTTLLACNGIHPDTIGLFQDAYIAFKEGESSTTSFQELARNNKFEALQFAFPTVSNFVLNLILTLGMENIYLFGVDLGFGNPEHHHSKDSDYYNESGQQAFDYQAANNVSLVVPGNFKKTVFTKHEFKISKQLMEQSIANYRSRAIHIYNCSNGAKIRGTNPLSVDNILISTDHNDKVQALHNIKTKSFSKIEITPAISEYLAMVKSDKIISDLASYEKTTFREVDSIEEAEEMINKQRHLIFDSYQNRSSLLFYYLHGTVNYSNAVLSKLLNCGDSEAESVQQFNRGIDEWHDTFEQISQILSSRKNTLDTASSMSEKRAAVKLVSSMRNKDVLVIADSLAYAKMAKLNQNWLLNTFNLTVVSPDSIPEQDFDFIITSTLLNHSDSPKSINKKAKIHRLDIVTDLHPAVTVDNNTSENTSLLRIPAQQIAPDNDLRVYNLVNIGRLACKASFNYVTGGNILPRETLIEGSEIPEKVKFSEVLIDCYDFLLQPYNTEFEFNGVLANGDRPTIVPQNIDISLYKSVMLSNKRLQKSLELCATLGPELEKDELLTNYCAVYIAKSQLNSN